MSIILKNAYFIDYKNFEIKNCHIKVGSNKNPKNIFYNDFNNIVKNEDDVIIDCTNKFVTKSFACGHHHAYSALARGMGGPLKETVNFQETLKYLWWALDKSLDKDAVEASAWATAISCAKNGVTFVIDHHASPFFVNGALDIIADTFEKVGLGHLLCLEISNRDGEEIARQGLEATEQYLETRKGLVGLHASFTVASSTLSHAVEIAEKYDSGIHIHTAEDYCDQDDCLKKYNKRVVERLYEAGVLNFSKTILVHCLHLNDTEKRIIEESPVFVAQNIESNLNNKVGIFNGNNMGKNIILGTDGMHSDMLRSLKATYIYGQTSEGISIIDAYDRLRNTHKYLENNLIEGDNENNLIILDYDSPTPVNSQNFLGHLIFGIDSNHIQHVISNGKLIVKDRILTTVDEAEVLKFTKETAEKLWKRYRKQKV